MADRYGSLGSEPVATLEEIFRWPFEGWTNEKIGYILTAHHVRHSRSSTKEKLRQKLMEWARDKRPGVPSTERTKSKVLVSYNQAIAVGGLSEIPARSSRDHILGSFHCKKAPRRRFNPD
ncbi:hypothetical protein IFR05_009477 [Cadophora sp. M221]|nr:hypothetical protein IFR05_009477 [Cadophora sp. M221]